MIAQSPAILSEDLLVPVSVVVSTIVCTATLVWKARGIIASNEALTKQVASLGKSLEGFASSLNSHVMESDTRDRDNREAHHSMTLTLSSNVESIKSLTKRMDRLESQCDKHHTRVAVIETKLDI